MSNTKTLTLVAFTLLALPACYAAPPPAFESPVIPAVPLTFSEPPVAPKPAAPRPFKGDNTAEMFDCLGPHACPEALEDRARRRAAAAFGCTAEEIETKARPARGLYVGGLTMVVGARGTAEIHVQPAKSGDAFYVTGCGQTGLLACVHANRTVHTAEQTYENTDDRLCLWATTE